MSFGWSASDIYTLAAFCCQLVDAVREGVASAPQLVQDLKNELDEFSTVLVDLQVVLKETNDIAFIDLKSIEQTLHACNTHLKKYKHLHPQKSPPNPGDAPANNNNASVSKPVHKLKRQSSFSSKSKEFFDKGWGTSQKVGQSLIFTNFGGSEELQYLQLRLARHRQTLSLYLQILERKRHAEESSDLQKRLHTVEALVRDLHSERRLSSSAGSPNIFPQTQHYQRQEGNGHENYEFVFQALNEQRRLAVVETKQADNDGTLQEWNDILDHLEVIHRRVLNAAERTANFTAQQRTSSASDQISLNRMLTPHHILGSSPTLRPISRVETGDSGFFELAPLPEESSGLTEAFVQSGTLTEATASSSPGVATRNRASLTPSMLFQRRRTSSVSSANTLDVERPPGSSSSIESISTPSIPLSSYNHRRTSSTTSSEISFPSTWNLVQLSGWVKCSTGSGGPMLCNIYAEYDLNGQALALKILHANGFALKIKLSKKRPRPIPEIEPSGERDNPDEGIMACFIRKIHTEPKDMKADFFFQDEKSLNKFESMVYGQELLFAMVIGKISSSSGGHSDRQRIRVWKKGDIKSLLFFTRKSWGCYVSIQAHDVLSKTINEKKKFVDLKLQNTDSAHCTHSHSLTDLKIVFENQLDLDLFTSHFLHK